MTQAAQNPPLDPSGNYDLSDREFDQIRVTIRDLTGISIAETKRLMIFRRLVGRLKVHNLATFAEYLEYLKSGDEAEVEVFSNAVTTNLTSFFREKHHFQFLINEFFPEVTSGAAATQKRLRIWSAGCSTGEEPYSIAMTLRDHFPNLKSWDAKVLCTDLDSDVLKKLQGWGVYQPEYGRCAERTTTPLVQRSSRWCRLVSGEARATEPVDIQKTEPDAGLADERQV